MQKSSERIERILEEVEKTSLNDVADLKVKIKVLVKRMKIMSNVFMILTFGMFINIYVTFIQKDYFNIIFSIIIFLFNLYNWLETYYTIRIYTSKHMVIHKQKVKND